MDSAQVARSPRAGILLRVSDERQSGNHSLPTQERECRARCEREGWDVVKVYLGDGESAFTGDLAKRQTMRDILQDADRGAIDILVVHESSRFGRNEALAQSAMDRLVAAGVRWVEAGSEMDYATPEGRVAFGINATLNAYWSRKMSQHIRKGFADLFANGIPTGDIPFGYRTTKTPAGKRGVPEVVDEEAVAIRKAFIDRAHGRGYLAIADEWNLLGLRPRSKQGPRLFGESAVQSVIENPFYQGIITYKGEFKRGRHTQIVSPTEFIVAQSAVRKQRGKNRSPNKHAILTGIVSCVKCGGPMWLAGKPTRNGGCNWYYQERSHLRGLSCEYERKSIRVDVADSVAERVVRAIGIGEEWRAFIESEARTAEQNPNAAKMLESLAGQRERWLEIRTMGLCTADRLRQALLDIDRQEQEIPPATTNMMNAYREFEGMAALWENLTNDERGEFCRMVFDTIVVDAVEKTVVEVVPRADFQSLFAARSLFCGSGFTPDRTRGLNHSFAISELGIAA